MISHWTPDKEQVKQALLRCATQAEREDQRDSHLLSAVFGRESGFYPETGPANFWWYDEQGVLQRRKRRMRRREWIEANFFIQAKNGDIIPLKLNLSADEKADLVLFLRGLDGEPIDPVVADPTHEVR